MSGGIALTHLSMALALALPCWTCLCGRRRRGWDGTPAL